MYMSRLSVTDPRAIVDFYTLHAFVYSLFPVSDLYTDRASDQSASLLYRLERGRTPYILMQSRVAPILGEFGELKRFDIEFKAGASYWFRLRGNTTKRRTEDHRRIAITDPGEQMAWLERKALDSGFVPVTANMTDRPGILYSERKGDPVSITPVTFEGELVVKDVDKFRNAWRFGVGSGKGFGCGLLTLASN